MNYLILYSKQSLADMDFYSFIHKIQYGKLMHQINFKSKSVAMVNGDIYTFFGGDYERTRMFLRGRRSETNRAIEASVFNNVIAVMDDDVSKQLYLLETVKSYAKSDILFI